MNNFMNDTLFRLQIIEKLSAKAPDTETKIKTLESIAEEHGIEWDSKALLDELKKSKNDLLVSIYDFCILFGISYVIHL
jgi:hypothetical protein